ncbi:hypothetical protein B5S32_g3085 [[Candida] boidinii]|nr:hypothetical protein B5S32_g3085 [[Candida] boidinii]
MELAISQRDTDILLKERNLLKTEVLEKYRLSGQIAQTTLKYVIELINNSYHLGKRSQPFSAAEICLLGDSFMSSLLQNAYKNSSIREKGIAQPVTLDVNDIVIGYSPEIDDGVNLFFQPGDIVSIGLGCQIDGYTSNVSHTLVIYPQGIQDGETGELKPTGPLLGSSADAICAAHIATETVIALLGANLTPEKIPDSISINKVVNGTLIRSIVDSIAKSYNCIVVPTSKVRRIRRFLAGQAEGVVAERDFKGVVWSEADQERQLLERTENINNENNNNSKVQELIKFDNSKSNTTTNASSAIPSDDFVPIAGEVYSVDIKMASIEELNNEPGLVTLEKIDNYTGKNHSKDTFTPRPSVFIRDVSISHQLKLKSSRALINKIDKDLSVYPFKLSYISKNFPFNVQDENNLTEQLKETYKEVKINRLGMTELSNRHLTVEKPVLRARFIPLQIILGSSSNSSTGIKGYDSENPTLPGLEIPLPRLGVTQLKLKTMLKSSKSIKVSRETSTVILNNSNSNNSLELIRLTGGSITSKPSWVHSKYQLSGEYLQGINELIQLTQDERFGIKIKECQPLKISSFEATKTTTSNESMNME